MAQSIGSHPPLKLDIPDALPPSYRERLDQHRAIFEQRTSMEQVMDDLNVRNIAQELEAHLRGQRIYAYHCTKEPSPGFFEARGLRVTDVLAHQAEFLAHQGHLFTADEIRHMQEAWSDYFLRGRQAQLRNGMVWCCLTRALTLSHGTQSFFQCFGGEAIYMPLKEHPTIGPKLLGIGRPVIVEFSVPYDDLKSFQELSQVVISRHHQALRADAHSYEAEARVRRAIQPVEILAVTPLDDFHVAGSTGNQGGIRADGQANQQIL